MIKRAPCRRFTSRRLLSISTSSSRLTRGCLPVKEPNYKGNATTVREYIMESILTPSKYVVPGFPDNVMPKDFGKKLNAAAINKVINYLSQLEEGKNPPKIE